MINGLDNVELRKIIETNIKDPEVIDAFAAAPAIEIVIPALRETDGTEEDSFRRISFLNPILKEQNENLFHGKALRKSKEKQRKQRKRIYKRIQKQSVTMMTKFEHVFQHWMTL